MTENLALKEEARALTRSLLAQSQSFLGMERTEQMALYKDLVNAHYNDLAEQQGLAVSMGDEYTAGGAIDPNRHINSRIGSKDKSAANVAEEFIKGIDFPGFVRDLLVGVFDANQDANERQMKAYTELLKEATKSLASFVSAVKDDEAMVRLVESDNNFKLAKAKIDSKKRPPRNQGGGKRDNPGNQPENTTASQDQQPGMVLIGKDGKEVNMNDSSIQAKLLDAKLAMAKERRTLLRETLLMGVSRLVVEKGTIRANVKFQIKADESAESSDYATADTQRGEGESSSVYAGVSVGYGIFSANFGASRTKSKSKVMIGYSDASTDSKQSTSMQAEMEGFVEIQFKSDYFKLDNFTQLFDLGQGQIAQGPPGQAKPQVPQGTAPAPQLPSPETPPQ